MKISSLVSAALLSLGLIALSKFGYELVASAQDYRDVQKLSKLSQVRSSWINGTVDLSLERSVVQVALAVTGPAPQAFINLIDEQRKKSDQLFDAAVSQISNLREMATRSAFLSNVKTARAEVDVLRTEVDAMLGVPLAQRSQERVHDIPYALKAEISKLKSFSDYLKIPNEMTSSTAIVLAGIQDRAWEIREFGGRARTYYAIATMNQTKIDEVEMAKIFIDNKRSKNAWDILTNLMVTVELPDSLLIEIRSAQNQYFDEYIKIIENIDASMAAANSDVELSLPIGFDAFFVSSSEALDGAANLSIHAGQALLAYWEGRSQVKFVGLLLSMAAVLFILILVPAMMFIVRSRISIRLEATAASVLAVADGDLDHPVDTRDNDLVEIVTLTRGLQVLKETLMEAKELRMVQDADQVEQQDAVNALTDGLQRMANGDLRCTIISPFAEKYDALRVNFNITCQKLNGLLQAVVGHSAGINQGASEVSSGSDNLSHRTESQAAALAQTSASLKQLTDNVRVTAQSADQADQNIVQTKESANVGNRVVHEAIDAMHSIKTSSEKIALIMEMIDDIAFQTNLLALNAGVVAAGAGEAGAGFSVVATEVRSLSHRTSDAAKEIKELIMESSDHVEEGVNLVASTGSSLSEIIGMVDNISNLVSEISAASQQQADSLGEINLTVAELDRVTQQNAAMAEESTAASHLLRDEAGRLNDLSGQFALDDGEETSSVTREQFAA